MKTVKVKQVNKTEAVKYLIPVLRELVNLNIPYEITKEHIIINIPKYIPMKGKNG